MHTYFCIFAQPNPMTHNKKEQIDHAGVSYITSQIWTLYMHLELCGVKQKKHKFDAYSHP